MKLTTLIIGAGAILASMTQAAVTDLGSFNGSCYSLYSGSDAASERGARRTCARKHRDGYLAEIDDGKEFKYLAKKVKVPAFIDSWQGDDYGKTCITFWPGGAITAAVNGCDADTPFICEYPCPN